MQHRQRFCSLSYFVLVHFLVKLKAFFLSESKNIYMDTIAYITVLPVQRKATIRVNRNESCVILYIYLSVDSRHVAENVGRSW